MRVLIIEDDFNKREQLCGVLTSAYPSVLIQQAGSYHSGVGAVQDQVFDFILLDMTIPTFDITQDEPGGEIEGYGGRDFLEEVDRLGLQLQVIVVTQFDRFGEPGDEMTLPELDDHLTREFPNIYFGAVFYSSARDDWKRQLQQKIAAVRLGEK